ncbi:MAG: DUF4230 domain-containing protein [Chloroflexota bacterium]
MEEKLTNESLPDETREKERAAPSGGPAKSGWTNCLLVGVGGLLLLCIAAVVGAVMILKPPPPTTPTPTPEPVRRITPLDIRNLAQLESTEYYLVAEISQVQVPESWLDELGILKEEIFILEYGTVVGGFDLTTLPDDAIWQEGDRVMLKLPAPEILRVELDPEKSHVVYHKGWCPEVICGDDLDRFLSDIEPEAINQLRRQAIEYGLLERTALAGRDYFYHLLKSLGFSEVRVVVDGYIYE